MHFQHYGLKGSILLGKQIAAKIVELLKEKNLLVKSGYSLPESKYPLWFKYEILVDKINFYNVNNLH